MRFGSGLTCLCVFVTLVTWINKNKTLGRINSIIETNESSDSCSLYKQSQTFTWVTRVKTSFYFAYLIYPFQASLLICWCNQTCVQIEDESLTSRLPGCVPLLLCSMELSGWTMSLQSAESDHSSPALLPSLAQRSATYPLWTNYILPSWSFLITV